MQNADGRDVCGSHRRQTVDDDITAYAGLDVHKNSIAIAAAAPGRAAPRFLGTTGPVLAELLQHKARVAFPIECDPLKYTYHSYTRCTRSAVRDPLAPVDMRGPYQNL